MSLRRRETIGWIDLLRVVAAFLVVFSHNCDSFIASFDTDYSQFLCGVWVGSLTRQCVPLFVLMTGVLLLPVREDESLSSFYRKRIGRIIPPLIFWSIALPVAFWAYYSTVGSQSANPMMPLADYDYQGLLTKLYTWIFNFNFDTIPLWYLYMLVGLYFIMPILSAWLRSATKKEIELLLKLWAVSLFLPYLQMLAPWLGYKGNFGNMGILGMCDWNIFGTFYYISGFIGYLLAAYYLTKWPLQWSWRKTLTICLPVFVVGYAITAGGYIWFQQLFPGNYAYLEIIWLFCGINVAMMTLPVFIVVQKWAPRGSKFLTWLASLSFGVYLCHFVFVYMAYDWFNVAGLSAVVRIVLGTLTSALLAVLVSFIFNSIGALRRFVC
ncbi:MAG: acyltransferase [Muribaculum sp.]|nr:acyltransferase [Muribaculum sp.]